MKLVVSQAAAADLARLRSFLADRNPAAAGRAVAALIAAMQSLDRFPERGRPSGTPGVRELIVPFGGSGYVLRYAYSAPENEVVIIRIWHDSHLARPRGARLMHSTPTSSKNYCTVLNSA